MKESNENKKKELETLTESELKDYINNTLNANHLKDLHEKSGLSYETIYKAGYRSGAKGWEIDIYDLLNQTVLYSRTRLNQPTENGQKYTQPSNTEAYPYVSRLLDPTLILSDINLPIIITEGEKKADSAIQHGFTTISIPGVYGWSKEKQLSKPMKLILKEGRTIYLCFDSDIQEKEEVKEALIRLAKEAYRQGCVVKQINLPRETKGIDDFFVYHGAENGKKEFQKLLSQATDPLKDILKSYDETYRLINNFKIPRLNISKLPITIQKFHHWSKDSTHTADELIIGGFIGCCSGALGKNVCLEGPGGKLIYPNLWIALIADSGAGKTTALNISVDLLADINNPIVKKHLEQLKEYEWELAKSKKDENSSEPIRPKCKQILLPSISSPEKIYEILALDHSAGLIAVTEELSIVFADIDKERNQGAKPLYISLYGGSKVAPVMSFKNSRTLPLIENPAISILGASTLELMFRYFKPEDFYSGFLQRFCFIPASTNKKKQALPPVRSKEGEIQFREKFKNLYELDKKHGKESSVYKLSTEAIKEWTAAYERLNSQTFGTRDGRILSALNRINDEIIFKLALIFHCLEFPDQEKISPETLSIASYYGSYLKECFITILDQLDSSRIRKMMFKIIDKTRTKLKEGYKLRDLANKCKGFNNNDFDEALDKLEELGIIEIKEAATKSNNGACSKLVFLLEKNL